MDNVNKEFETIFKSINMEDARFMILGFLFMFCFVILFKNVLNRNDSSTFKNADMLLFLFSPDYSISRLQKQGKEGATLGEYIKRNNTANLSLSSVIVVLLLILNYTTQKGSVWFVLISILGYRILSRTIEINKSFLDDVCDEKKQSGLEKFDRIKLALKSLLEESILFFGFYSLMSYTFNFKYIITCLIAGARSFIPSIPDADGNLISLVATYQAISAFILITLSIATYISSTKNKKKDPSESEAPEAPENNTKMCIIKHMKIEQTLKKYSKNKDLNDAILFVQKLELNLNEKNSVKCIIRRYFNPPEAEQLCIYLEIKG